MNTKMKLNPTVTTLTLDPTVPAVALSAGNTKVSLSMVENRLTPDDATFLGQPAENNDAMGLRLAMSALVIPIVAWLQKPNEKNEKTLVEGHDAFAQIMQLSPEQGMLLAVENGVQVMQRALKALQGKPEPVKLMPTGLELGTKDGQRTVKISCGESAVVLAQVPGDKPGELAINAIHEEGEPHSDEYRNLKLTFMSLTELLKDYLVQAADQDVDEVGKMLVMANAGWNELKEHEPEMAQSMVPGIMGGSVQLATMPVDVPQEDAEALIKKYEDGEISMEDLRKNLGATGPLH